MTALEYMEKQIHKGYGNYDREHDRGAPDEVLDNILLKIGYYEEAVYWLSVVRCQNCNWWHRHKSGDLSRGVCDKYAVSKNENGFCDEPLLEERKLPWKN